MSRKQVLEPPDRNNFTMPPQILRRLRTCGCNLLSAFAVKDRFNRARWCIGRRQAARRHTTTCTVGNHCFSLEKQTRMNESEIVQRVARPFRKRVLSDEELESIAGKPVVEIRNRETIEDRSISKRSV